MTVKNKNYWSSFRKFMIYVVAFKIELDQVQKFPQCLYSKRASITEQDV